MVPVLMHGKPIRMRQYEPSYIKVAVCERLLRGYHRPGLHAANRAALGLSWRLTRWHWRERCRPVP